MHKIRIGGVPEHFNFPWNFALEQKDFANKGIDLQWRDFPGGTGAMVSALKNDELDMALLLTEGAVKEIVNGATFKIAFPYVNSPLVWGIHTASNNAVADIHRLKEMRYAISRIGSGSHLMAYVHAKTTGTTLTPEQMVLIGDLTGARKALAEGKADLFFWERFMTKPYVDNGELSLLGQFPTPWPCFVWVASEKYVNNSKYHLNILSEILYKTLEKLYQNVNFTSMISQRYELQLTDVENWLSLTKWAADNTIQKSSLQKVINSLREIGMIEADAPIESLVFPSIRLI